MIKLLQRKVNTSSIDVEGNVILDDIENICMDANKLKYYKDKMVLCGYIDFEGTGIIFVIKLSITSFVSTSEKFFFGIERLKQCKTLEQAKFLLNKYFPISHVSEEY